MARITANELKTRGIAAIESGVRDGGEASITVRGDDRYVVMPIQRYHFLRECELEYALAESRADMKAGRVHRETPARHVKRALDLARSKPARKHTPRSPARKVAKPKATRTSR